MGIVFNIQRFCTEDGTGIRTTVFLKGCPLKCLWCHNPESQNTSPELLGDELCGREMSADEVLREVLKDKNFYEVSGGGLTLSGGEPLFQGEFSLELLKKAKEENLHTCIETSGFASKEIIIKTAEYTDLYLYDIKESDTERHRKYTGADNTFILENLKLLDSLGKKIILRCPIIPNFNDRGEHFVSIAKIANKLSNIVEIQIEPYHDLGVSKYERLGKEYKLDTFLADSEAVTKYIEEIQKHTKIQVKSAR